MDTLLNIDVLIKPIYDGRSFTGDHQLLAIFRLHRQINIAEILENDDMYGRRLDDATFTGILSGSGAAERIADDIADDAGLFHQFNALERVKLRGAIQSAAQDCFWKHLHRSPSYPDYLSRIPPQRKNK